MFDIFEECIEWTFDPDIEIFLRKLTKGNFPPELSYSNNSIIFENNKYTLTNDSFKNFKILLDIFKKINSKPRKNNDVLCMRSKKIKQRALIHYVIANSIKYSLSLEESKKLYASLNLYLALKLIKTSDIVYEQGKIVSITNVHFEQEKVFIKTKKFEPKSSESSSHNDKISQMLERYIKEYKNLLVS